MIRRILSLLGVRIESMGRKEAAQWLLSREIRVVYRPAIVLEDIDAAPYV